MTAPQTTADVLDAAADLLSAPGAWTQGRFARDAEGLPVPAKSEEATCWCAFGAIWRISDTDLPIVAASDALEKAIQSDVAPWNDAPGRRQSEVVGVLRKVAAAERAASGMQPPVAGEGVGA